MNFGERVFDSLVSTQFMTTFAERVRPAFA